METCKYCGCDCEIKDKVINGKIYKNICKSCFVEINESKKLKFERLKSRLDTRKNILSYLLSVNIPVRYTNCSYQNYDGKFDTSIIKSESMAFYYGEPGTGKTHLAVSEARRSIWHGLKCHFVTVPYLLMKLRSSFSQVEAAQEMEIIDGYIYNWDLLVLDDLGAEKTTDYALQALYLIIDGRYGNKNKTIITSNLNPVELATKLGDRISSRVLSGLKYKTTGTDRRLN